MQKQPIQNICYKQNTKAIDLPFRTMIMNSFVPANITFLVGKFNGLIGYAKSRDARSRPSNKPIIGE
ncbi:hypothetical protein CFF01_08450 [Shewanella marisflavi]|uniref:Uncharacterized protein n=1 Tax=Shewanella marisflavi TaxID=260364 RepID=A0AAC9TXE3_9GAMM|nr:hypothetical protein CFF01_08450 [Shewanella marisflavi]